MKQTKQKTHVVLDLHYLPSEGQECFCGTESDCYDFVAQQGLTSFMYKVVPMTIEEIDYLNKIEKDYETETEISNN